MSKKFALVAIGASAGGLEALTNFVKNLAIATPVPIVVVQHLSPDNSSLLAELLAKHSTLPVKVITSGLVPLAAEIYITPPNLDVVYENGRLILTTPSEKIGPKPSVNRMFRSMAEAPDILPVGIILSGTGSDGASGIEAIKSSGGITVVQEPGSAKYNGMPLASIHTGAVDHIMDPQTIALQLSAILQKRIEHGDAQQQQSAYYRIIGLTRAYSGIDLTHYKNATIERRIERQMHNNKCALMKDYADLLTENAEKIEEFIEDVLIPVTEFFRDKECFNKLKKLLQKRLMQQPSNATFRIWVPGCATGEEAYTLSMMIEEINFSLGTNHHYQIFATDLSQETLNIARTGVYTLEKISVIPDDVVKRYFDIGERHARVRNQLRDRITFSRHNLTDDPPFSRINLISCRNLLIYFDNILQKHVKDIFHYSLATDGLLLLGKSESFGNSALFDAIDGKARIYQKNVSGKQTRKLPFMQLTPPTASPAKTISKPKHQPTLEELANKALSGLLAPRYLVVDRTDTITFISEGAKKLLRFQNAEPSLLIYDLLPRELTVEVKALLFRVKREMSSTCGIFHTVSTDEGDLRIQLQLVPLDYSATSLFVVLLNQQTSQFTDAESDDPNDQQAALIQQLKHELAATEESLQTVIEELKSSNEELQSMNEELQSANEEMQSSNEELQTTNEELQSTNEELLTVNDEVLQKNQQLENLNTEFENLYRSSGTLFLILNKDFHVTRADPRLRTIIDVDEFTEGKYWKNLRWQVPFKLIESLSTETKKTGQKQHAVTQLDDLFLQVDVSPYLINNKTIAGVVIGFTDISEQQNLRLKAEKLNSELADLINANPDGVIAINAQGIITQCNQQASIIFGYESAELISQNVNILMPSDIASKHDGYIARYKETHQRHIIGAPRRLTGLTKSKQIIPLELHIAELTNPNQDMQFIGVIRDISALVALEDKLQLLENQASITLDNIHDAVVRVDHNWHIMFANAEAKDWFNQDDYLDKRIGSVLKLYDEGAKTPIELAAMLEANKTNFKALFVSQEKECILQLKIYPFKAIGDNAEQQYVLVIQDITVQEKATRKVEWESQHDALTGLLNRNQLIVHLQRLLARLQNNDQLAHTLMFIDLDQFKVVNDSAGHQAGDELLKQLSQDISRKLRSRDILARLGGDEFALLLESCPLQRAEHIASDLIHFIQETRFSYNQKLFRIGASIGIVQLKPSMTANELLSQADHACYVAKERGRNTFVVADNQNGQDVFAEMLHIQSITDALENNKFEFYFQKIVSTREEKEKTYWEILLRLRNEQNELVYPGTFLPIAERFNLMQRIDTWVLINLALKIKKLLAHSHTALLPRLSVNISAQSLSNHDLVNVFEDAFSTSGLDFSKLTVEVTETAAITHYSAARESLNALSELGVQIALDDFGSGMASFNYIRKLPIDVIKIDGSIIKDIETDLLDATLVQSIQQIAEVLDCTTVAEFVESKAIAERLKSVGIHYLQGYYIGKPISFDEWKQTL